MWRDGNLCHSSLRFDLAKSKSFHWGTLLEWPNLHEVSHTVECNSINYQDQTPMITHSHNLTHEWKRVQIFASLQSSMKSSLCARTTSLLSKLVMLKTWVQVYNLVGKVSFQVMITLQVPCHFQTQYHLQILSHTHRLKFRLLYVATYFSNEYKLGCH